MRKRPSSNLVIALALLLLGCDVKVSAQGALPGAPTDKCFQGALSETVIVTTIDQAVSARRYHCVEQAFNEAKALPRNPIIVDRAERILRNDLQTSAQLPEATRVSALSYLISVAEGDIADYVNRNLPLVKNVATSGDEMPRAAAIAILATRRSDEDLAIFAQGIASGAEAVMAFSAFAAADNCSSAAKKVLRDGLASVKMREYLKKYAGKESVTTTLASRCPEAAR